MKHKSLLRTKH